MTDQPPTRPSAVTIAALERQLQVAQRITQIGSWEWDATTGVVTWSDELYRIYDLPPGTAITFEGFLARVHPEDRDRTRRQIEAALQRGGRFAHDERIVRPDGSIRELESVGEVTSDAAGRPLGLIGTCRDVTEERRRERALERARRQQLGEARALELLAEGASLEAVLGELASSIEELEPGALVSVLIVDRTGTRLVHGAAPSLPDAYNRAIDGATIGPSAGSCGTAVFRREPVVVVDLATDPLWDDYRHLALPHGLRACWSSPLLATDGRVLGTFAIYHREPREPSEELRELVARSSHVAGIAIERRRLDDQLRALSERSELIREDERTKIAREIHDELGQALTALKMDLAWIARRMGPATKPAAPVQGKLAEMLRASDAIIQAVRRISAELRPGILDDLGLGAAIEWQLAEFERRTGLPCTLRSTLGEPKLDRELATAVFRIFQEALTNIARHAGASEVTVELALEGGRLSLEVADDGVGLRAPASTAGSLGLLGMRERARRLGGDCEVRRRAPRGTVVSLVVPLRSSAERRTAPDTPIGP